MKANHPSPPRDSLQRQQDFVQAHLLGVEDRLLQLLGHHLTRRVGQGQCETRSQEGTIVKKS
jgi:hypothetical protein